MYEKGKALLKQISEYHKGKGDRRKPKTVVNFLLTNKMVLLKSIYNATKGDLSKVIFYDIVERVVPKGKRFNFYETGYVDDFAITLERANAVAAALKEAKYKVVKKEFVLVDNDDYLYYIKDVFSAIDFKSIKSQTYIEEKSLEYKYFKRDNRDIKGIDELIEGYKNQNENRNNFCENKMKSILSDLGISFEYQRVFCIDNKFYIADFYIPDNNVILEVDGASHDDICGLSRDRERDNAFARHGVLTVRFRTYEVVEAVKVKQILSKLLLNTTIN